MSLSGLKQPLFGSLKPIARAPFNRSLADVIIRSSDKVEFHLSKVILTLASSFFEDMFSRESLTHPNPQGERHIIDVPEDSHALDLLFRFCYPVDNPSINDLATLGPVLAAATKYDVQVAINALYQTMDCFLTVQPMEVYKLACSQNLEQKASAAAVACRRKFIRDDEAEDFSKTTSGVAFVPGMCSMTAGAYYRLLRIWRSGKKTTPSLPSSGHQASALGFHSITTATTSWNLNPHAQRNDTDIILRSSDGVTFNAHELILRLWGADDLLKSAVTQSTDSLRLLQTDIHSSTLSTLLQMCYPFNVEPKTKGFDCRKYNDVLDIANRLGMKPLVDVIRANWGKGSETSEDLLGAFLIAARLDWSSEARYIAERLRTRSLLEVYSTELERTPARLYHALLRYHHSCQTAIRQVWLKRQYSSGYHFGRKKWDHEWFTQSVEGTHARFISTVIVEAEHDKGSPFDVQDMAGKTRTLEDETKVALNAVKFELT